MAKIRLVKHALALVFRILLIVALGFAIYNANWIDVLFLTMIFLITFIPDIIRKKLIYYPNELEIIMLLFIIASLYLGEMNRFYMKFAWWDLMLHTISGLIFGQIGFALIYQLNKEANTKVNLSPFFIALFAFCFAMTMGVVWEIFEFGMDQSFGLNMQKSGIVDTMWDLIVNTIGSLTVVIFGYIYLKDIDIRKKVKYLRNMITK